MESEQRGIREKETTEWMEQAIKSMADEYGSCSDGSDADGWCGS